MVTGMAFSALLILAVAATRVIHRLAARHAERIALPVRYRLPPRRP